MKLLLDTHVAIWFATDAARLADATHALIEGAEAVFLSAASLWEISIKVATGKLTLDIDGFLARLAENAIDPLPVTWAHALAVRVLPPIHRDPFDRLLVAQAMAEPLRLLTGDAMLAGYSDLVTVV